MASELFIDPAGLHAYADSKNCTWELGLDTHTPTRAEVCVFFYDKGTGELAERINIGHLNTAA